MTDPVRNVEIEDVLSSIRRLVSEESQPPREYDPPSADRFVLSPALRVPEDEIGPAPSDETPDDQGPVLLTQTALPPGAKGGPSGDETGESFSLSDQGPTAEHAERHGIDHWSESRVSEPWNEGDDDFYFGRDERDEPDMAESLPSHAEMSEAPVPEDPVPEDLAEADQIAALRASLDETFSAGTEEVEEASFTGSFDEWVEEGEPVLTEDLDPEGSGTKDSVDRALDDKIETLERMLHHQSQGWTPESEGEQTPFDDPSTIPDPTDASIPEGEDARDAAERAEMVAEESTEVACGNDTLSGLVEAAEGDFEDQPDRPDPADDRAAAGKPAFVRHASTQTLEWEDHAPGSYQEVAAPAPPEDQPSALAKIDEEALQALVTDIVRQELKGALGERITRNVRKLVRREIHRVLMSQDLD